MLDVVLFATKRAMYSSFRDFIFSVSQADMPASTPANLTSLSPTAHVACGASLMTQFKWLSRL